MMLYTSGTTNRPVSRPYTNSRYTYTYTKFTERSSATDGNTNSTISLPNTRMGIQTLRPLPTCSSPPPHSRYCQRPSRPPLFRQHNRIPFSLQLPHSMETFCWTFPAYSHNPKTHYRLHRRAYNLHQSTQHRSPPPRRHPYRSSRSNPNIKPTSLDLRLSRLTYPHKESMDQSLERQRLTRTLRNDRSWHGTFVRSRSIHPHRRQCRLPSPWSRSPSRRPRNQHHHPRRQLRRWRDPTPRSNYFQSILEQPNCHHQHVHRCARKR